MGMFYRGYLLAGCAAGISIIGRDGKRRGTAGCSEEAERMIDAWHAEHM